MKYCQWPSKWRRKGSWSSSKSAGFLGSHPQMPVAGDPQNTVDQQRSVLSWNTSHTIPILSIFLYLLNPTSAKARGKGSPLCNYHILIAVIDRDTWSLHSSTWLTISSISSSPLLVQNNALTLEILQASHQWNARISVVTCRLQC